TGKLKRGRSGRHQRSTHRFTQSHSNRAFARWQKHTRLALVCGYEFRFRRVWKLKTRVPVNKTFNIEINLIEQRGANSRYAWCARTIRKADRAERCVKKIYSVMKKNLRIA